MATTVCARGVYTHSVPHAQFSDKVSLLDVQTRTRARSRLFAVRMSNFSTSPSPFSRFIRLPCCSRTVTSRPPSRLQRPRLPCRTVPRPESACQAHFRTSAEEFGHLADPTHSTGTRSRVPVPPSASSRVIEPPPAPGRYTNTGRRARAVYVPVTMAATSSSSSSSSTSRRFRSSTEC